jgi:predicted translin family RNA/ssDNA-binding protein
MGVIPVPEEVREIAHGIEALVSALKEQSMWMEKIHSHLVEIKAGTKIMKELEGKLDAMQGTLTTTRDSLRMMVTLMERKG